MAGRLIEKVSGMNLENYFRKNIFEKLGMSRTWFNVPDSLNPSSFHEANVEMMESTLG